MSDVSIFASNEIKILQFITVEHGSKKITITIFGPKRPVDFKEATEILIDPDEAIKLAMDLIRRAEMIKEQK